VGLKVGSILAISDGSSGATAAERLGDFSQSIAIVGALSSFAFVSPYTPPPTCTMTVQFQLTR
jgi:hypothetical protein